MPINKEWHLANKMPKNPTEEQRVTWHFEHAKHCRCRLPDAKMQAEFKERGLTLPRNKA